VIGIPYRDEAFGEAILKDIDVVAEGTQCRVVVIRPGQTLGDVHVDALFFPGGRFDQPDTDTNVKGNSSRWPRPEQKDLLEELFARHDREITIIKQAEQRNIPILGVCGGSRRLATAKGATQKLLTGEQARVHTSNMETVAVREAHPITISAGTMLHRIVATGHYRRIPAREIRQQVEKDIELAVNSVHWASSHFPETSQVEISATHEGVVEGFEDPRFHYHVGVQWHPEHAQLGQGDFKGKAAEPHQRVMASLGQAAVEGRATRIIQSGIRGFLARRRLEELRTGQQTPSLLPSSSAAAVSPLSTSAIPQPRQQTSPSLLAPTRQSPRLPPSSLSLSASTTSQGPQPRLQTSPPRQQPQSSQVSSSAPRLWADITSSPAVIASSTSSTSTLRSGQSGQTPRAPSQRTTTQTAVLRLSGRVDWYSAKDGYGFIIGTNGGRYYFRGGSVTSGRIQGGASVTFVPVNEPKGWAARNVIIG
jgi:gamma-glutamyl-gamma-aminobutyrate hydrolase PuuD/cold shock CspA family protein